MGDGLVIFVTLMMLVTWTWSVTVVRAVSVAALAADLSDDEIDFEIDFSMPLSSADDNSGNGQGGLTGLLLRVERGLSRLSNRSEHRMRIDR